MESDEIDLYMVILTFITGHVTKISLHYWKEHLKISRNGLGQQPFGAEGDHCGHLGRWKTSFRCT